MGLGKTVQSIAVMTYLLRVKKVKPPFCILLIFSCLHHLFALTCNSGSFASQSRWKLA